MKKSLISSVLVVALIAACGLFISCQEESSPVQNQQDERTPTMMYKTNAIKILTLNPPTNPGGNCTLGDYYSSGGKNAAPLWRNYTLDLSAYANRNVKIIFTFQTRDGLYNAYEGWYVDDISIDGTLDDVESGAGAWTTTGYWHITTNRSSSATHSWRYANSATGNYQGASISGFCSDQANQGSLTSGMVGLGSSPSLTFSALWIIEAVNANTFDLMEVYVEDLGVIPAAIDIKPGGCPNPLNVKANGTFPVAIVGTNTFDVTMVDPATVMLTGDAGTVAHGPQVPWMMDVATPYFPSPLDCDDCISTGADGFMDITYYFDTQTLVPALGYVDDGDCKRLTVTGRFYNGWHFAGYDNARIIKKGK